jgi:hypothetical protein
MSSFAAGRVVRLSASSAFKATKVAGTTRATNFAYQNAFKYAGVQARAYSADKFEQKNIKTTQYQEGKNAATT